MSVWQTPSTFPVLQGVEGDLLSLRVTVEAHLLEELLETLAEAPFPINPEIEHHAELVENGKSTAAVHVEFPVWRLRVPELRAALEARGFRHIRVRSMFEEITQEG
ncbi:MAG: hypothetical protein NZV14_10455 [Bryobacteraceae bacterium]|nr:hypothetical protein [Bryobacteraceae bacterium]MDW8378574.1 hypothetical protein [Bryobacterales bacterium]